MTESETPPPDPLRLLYKHRLVLACGTLIGLAVFSAAALVLPKKYKTHFVLTIHAGYFENPLIRDFLPEVHDPGEKRSQREALIREALSFDFLDSLDRKLAPPDSGRPPGALRLKIKALARRLGLKSSNSAAALARRRSLLLERIEINRLNTDTFRVSFVHSEPAATLQAVQNIHAQVVRTLTESRRGVLIKVREAIGERMKALDGTDGSAGAWARRLRAGEPIEDWSPLITRASARGWEPSRADSELEIYRDLMKKMNYLNIALDSDGSAQGAYLATLEEPLYPVDPLWPKKGLFAVWGLAAGFLGSFLSCGLREYQRWGALNAEAFSRRTKIPLLGALPAMPKNGALRAFAGRNQ